MDSEKEKLTLSDREKLSVVVYKWLKIAQAIMIIALGAIFIITSFANMKADDESTKASLPIALGVVLAIYGIMDAIAGYILHRSIVSSEVVAGVILISLSIVMFVLRIDFIEVLNIFIIAALFIISGFLILFGVDRILGRAGIKKDITKAIFGFVFAALLIVAAILYLIYKDEEVVRQWLMAILGLAMLAVGVTSFVLLIIKIRNTNKAIKANEENKDEEEVVEEEKKELTVIDISQLKKDKKVHNKEVATKTIEDEKEVKEIKNKE